MKPFSLGLVPLPQAAPRTIPQKSEQGWARRSAHRVSARKPKIKPRTPYDLLGYKVASESDVTDVH